MMSVLTILMFGVILLLFWLDSRVFKESSDRFIKEYDLRREERLNR